MEQIKLFFSENAEFGKNIGIKLLDVKYGYAKAKMKVTKFHLNLAGVCHGGAIFTLADFAFGVASNSFGKIALGIDTSISFINAAKEGDELIAEAKLVGESNGLVLMKLKLLIMKKLWPFLKGQYIKLKKI
jgi:acyl-CoA thioesterase